MSNPGVAFDRSLIQAPGLANASIAGIPLRINPNSVSLSYQMKMSQTQTVGGFVFQIFGVMWSDLVVEGQFGVGGWPAQLRFFQALQTLATTTAADQRIQGLPGNSIEPTGAFRFLFPLLGYDFQVFLKGYASAEGQSVELYNENINPSWQLTFTIDNDNANLTKVATNAYIARLQQGIGYEPNQFNGPDGGAGGNVMSNLTTFLQTYANNNNLTQALSGTFGVSPSDSSSTTGSATAANLIGNSGAQQVFNFFMGKGLTDFQSAGIVGNFMQESGCNPESVQQGGPGRGLAQWSVGGRWPADGHLMTGNVGNDMAAQLNYVWSELQGGFAATLTQLKATTNVTDATTVFEATYEIAGIAALDKRIAYAQQALAQFGNQGGTG